MSGRIRDPGDMLALLDVMAPAQEYEGFLAKKTLLEWLWGNLTHHSPEYDAYSADAHARREQGEVGGFNWGWNEALESLNLLDDFTIAGQRRIRGVGDEHGLEYVAQELGRTLRDGTPYRSPYEEGNEYDLEPAKFWERFISGAIAPGGLLEAVPALAMAVPLGLKAVRKAARGLADDAFKNLGDDAAHPLRTLTRGQLGDYLTAVHRLPKDKRAFLTPYTLRDLTTKFDQGAIFRMSDDGVGYILHNGDLQGLINASGRRGAGAAALDDAIQQGARTLDAYDGFLSDLYKSRGFEEVGRFSWDPQYASADWDYARYGEPDVVMMRRPASEGMVDLAADLARPATRSIDEAMSVLPEPLRGNQAIRTRLEANRNIPDFDPRVWERPAQTNPRLDRYLDPDTGLTNPDALPRLQRERYGEIVQQVDQNYDTIREIARRGLQDSPDNWYWAQQHLSEVIEAVGDAEVGRAVFDQWNIHSALFSPMSSPKQEVARATLAYNHAVRYNDLGPLMDQIWPKGLGHKANKSHIPAAQRLWAEDLFWDPITGSGSPFGSSAIKTEEYGLARIGNPGAIPIDVHADRVRGMSPRDLQAVLNPPDAIRDWNRVYREGLERGADLGQDGWMLHQYATKYAGNRPMYQLDYVGAAPNLGTAEGQAGRDLFVRLANDLSVPGSHAQGGVWGAARDITGVRDPSPITDVISEVFATQYGAVTSQQRVDLWRQLLNGEAVRSPHNLHFSRSTGMTLEPAMVLLPLLLPITAIAIDDIRQMYGEDYVNGGYLEDLSDEDVNEVLSGSWL
jgi:hypothetical protein